MREEFYFTFNNKTSECYFSDNSANNFCICLEQKLNFYDQYECALVDFSCTTEYFDTTTKEISIHFNLYEQQLVDWNIHSGWSTNEEEWKNKIL